MFGKSKAEKPKNGVLRILETTLNKGQVSYSVQEYTISFYGDMGWQHMDNFSSFEKAKAFVDLTLGERVASKRVVWP